MIVTNSLTGGGAERSMNLVCNELTRRGWSVSLVPINRSSPDLVTPVCEVFGLDRKWKGGLIGTVVALLKFNRVARVWKPEFVILNCDLPELFGAFLFKNQKLIAFEHASTPWGHRPLIGKVTRLILNFRRTTWVAVSSHLTIWPKGMKPSTVLENPIIPAIRVNPKQIDNQLKRLVLIGRLSREKQPELALEIAKLTNIEVLVIGDGELRETLENKANKESIRAQFVGRVANPWLLLQPEDLLILTSSFEGDGLVVVEGLQYGVPMLVMDIPDLRRFNFPNENHATGLEDFVERINSHKQRLSNFLVPTLVADRILSKRSLESVGNSWEEFLASV